MSGGESTTDVILVSISQLGSSTDANLTTNFGSSNRAQGRAF